MMVAEGQRCHLLGIGLQVGQHVFGRGDASDQQHVLVGEGVEIPAPLLLLRRRKNRPQRLKLMGGEEELLVRVDLHGLGDDAEFHRFHVFRAFCDNHDVGPVLALDGFPQPSGRQQRVVDDQPVVVDEQDIDAGLHIAVLESIIEQDDVYVFDVFPAGQFVNAVCTFLVDGHRDIGKLGLHLVGFVTDALDRRLFSGQYKSVALAFVAPAQYRHLRLVFQKPYEVFHVGRLASTADGDVADGNDGNVKRPALQDTHVEEQVPEADAQFVEPAQRQQCLIDLNEVSFHLTSP